MPRNISTAAVIPARGLDEAVFRPKDRASLIASSVLRGGTLRSLAAAAGMMTVLGVSPAFAQCYSAGAGLAGSCDAIVPTGANATAIGSGANATGINATAYGAGSTANGGAASATGWNSFANGTNATATGASSNATGVNATATGTGSRANGTSAPPRAS